MKNLYLILFFRSVILSAQSLEENIVDEICSCLREEKVETLKHLDKSSKVCANRVVVKYVMSCEEGKNKNFENYL